MLNIKNLLKKNREAAAGVRGGVDEIQSQITVLVDQRAQIESLPLPFDDAMRAVDAWLDGYVAKSVSAGIFATGDPRDVPNLDTGEHSLLPALFVASCRAAIRDHFAEALQDFYETREAASAAQKVEKLAALDAEIYALGKAEEAAIRQAEADGVVLLRRRDADPAVVLLPDDRVL